MKFRIAALISSLAGGRSINICTTVPVQRTWESLKFRPWSQWIGSSSRSYLSFVKEDDSFAELGPEVNENAVSRLKLATEKPERFMWQNDSARKRLSNNTSHPVNKSGNEKGSVLTHNESNQVMNHLLDSFSANRSTNAVNGKAQWQNDSLIKRLTNNKCGSNDKGSVSTRDKSNQVTSQLLDSFRASPSTDTVKVKDIDTLGKSGQTMEEHANAASTANSSTIRIHGVDARVSIHDIHSLCGKCGSLEGLSWVGEESVDAFFKVKSESDLAGIVKKLNGYSIAGSHLTASVLSSNAKASIPESKMGWSERGLGFSSAIDELKRQMEWKKLYCQDLEVLHHGILHLQCLPVIGDD